MKRLWVLLTDHARLVVMTVGMMLFAQMAPADTHYVATNGPGPSPYIYWTNAANNIQDAINVAIGVGDTVLVSNGVYETGGLTNWPSGTLLTNRVAITNAIIVRSANNNPTNTIIKGAKNDGTNGPAAVRCVYMKNGSSLIGFTLTNGATFATVVFDADHNGGGVYGYEGSSATISKCVIANNSAGCMSGGVNWSTLYNCTIAGNLAEYGGGTYRGTLYNCTVVSNSANTYGGGVAYSYLCTNCTFIGNSVFASGGGIAYSTVHNSTFTGNSAFGSGSGNGGGVYDSTMSNCTIVGNGAANGGGGARLGSLYNCLIISNAAWDGGGAARSILYNCTIVKNTGTNVGGGMREGISYNCISWNNNRAEYFTTNYYSCGVGYTNGGPIVGNIASDPLFANTNIANYRLTAGSPCINVGTNMSWMRSASAKDLDGHSRIDRFSDLVDMGCYEYLPNGTMFRVR